MWQKRFKRPSKIITVFFVALAAFFSVARFAAADAICGCFTQVDGINHCQVDALTNGEAQTPTGCDGFCQDLAANNNATVDHTDFDTDATSSHGTQVAADCGTFGPPLDAAQEKSQGPDLTVPSTPSKPFVTPQLNFDIPGLAFTPILNNNGTLQVNFIADYVTAVYRVLLGVSVTVAIVMIMVGGFQYVISPATGDVKAAKMRIRNAVVGLVLLLSVYVILFTINPQLTLFNALKIQEIPAVEINNETPQNFSEKVGKDVASLAGGSPGWNGVPVYDQRDFATVPYGPSTSACFKPGVARQNDGNGTIASSGCGVVAFSEVASALTQSTIDPPTVAASFWSESGGDPNKQNKGFRPVDSNGCGTNGTLFTAFTDSELLAENGLVGRVIPRGDINQILDLLSKGKLVIVSYATRDSKGNLNGGGHYVVLAGLDDQGNLEVNNSYPGGTEIRPVSWLVTDIKSAVYVDTEADAIP